MRLLYIVLGRPTLRLLLRPLIKSKIQLSISNTRRWRVTRHIVWIEKHSYGKAIHVELGPFYGVLDIIRNAS